MTGPELILAVFRDLAELRDAVLILAGIAAAVVAFIFLVIVLWTSLKAYRLVRRLERLHDGRIAPAVTRTDQQLAQWLAEDRWSARGLAELAQAGAARVRRRKEPPRKRRLFGLLPPA